MKTSTAKLDKVFEQAKQKAQAQNEVTRKVNYTKKRLTDAQKNLRFLKREEENHYLSDFEPEEVDRLKSDIELTKKAIEQEHTNLKLVTKEQDEAQSLNPLAEWVSVIAPEVDGLLSEAENKMQELQQINQKLKGFRDKANQINRYKSVQIPLPFNIDRNNPNELERKISIFAKDIEQWKRSSQIYR